MSRIEYDEYDENEKEEIDYDEDLVQLVYKRFGRIRFYPSSGKLPKGYKPFARVACEYYCIVYGFFVAFLNKKMNKFTIRYTNSYSPWALHFLIKE